MAGFNYAQNIIGLDKVKGDIHELEVDVADLSASVLTISGDVDELELSVSQLSASLVTVQGAMTTANEEIDDIWKINNVSGAKNLITYPYYDGASKTHNGITFTVNADGSITANGTATDVANFILNDFFTLKAGSYIISGGKSVNQNVNLYYNVSPYTTVWQSIGDEVAFTTTQDYNPCRLRIRIASGEVLNNVTFYPMLRLGEYQDSTYAPYAMTNKELTDVVKCNQTTNGTYTLKATVSSSGVAYAWTADT